MPYYRTMCQVLEEVRKMDETKNYSGLLGAVEEIQGMGNRMESKLQEYKYAKENRNEEELGQLEKQLNKKRAELAEINKDIGNQRKDLKHVQQQIKSLSHIWKSETKGGTLNTGVYCDQHADNMACDCPKAAVTPEFITGSNLELEHGL